MKHLPSLYKPIKISLALLLVHTPLHATTDIASTASLIHANLQPETISNTYSPISNYFPRPAGLEDAVDFWRQVFGEWKAHQIVLHDDEYLGVVYEMIEVTGYIGGRLSAEQQAKVEQRKEHIAHQLNDINFLLHKRMALTTEQQNIYNLVVRKAGRKALKNAAERVRVQRGMKESFQTGLEASSRYSTLMREVFRKNHLPEELAHLPHVESAFTTSARSPVGAVGVWQFMPVTGKRYLRIDDALDERYDPILATQGAARYLQYAFGKLNDWGLAVTSYNYGLSGMVRARREEGRDIGRIVKNYNGASFGFASRNYYVEFLAVCDIMADLPRYFPGGVDYQQPPAIKQIEITKAMTSAEIAKKHHIPYTTLAELNPAWTKQAVEGTVALPANTAVWLPRFVPREERLLMTAKKTSTVAMRAGLGDFHLSYNQAAPSKWDVFEHFPNGLSGQLIAKTTQPKLPAQPVTPPTQLAQISKPSKPVLKNNKGAEIHIVQSGDSVSTIASKYSVQIRALLALNEISADTLIRPGQPIRIPLKINS